MDSTISAEDLATLRDACARLENPSLIVRLSSALGMPVESVARQITRRAPKALVDAVGEASRKGIEVAMFRTAQTLREGAGTAASPVLHTAAAATTGAVAGFFGLQTLVLELPVTTAIMFRSIVDIARAEGESPLDPGTLVSAMSVFAMGSGRSSRDDAAETSYYGVRLALGKAVTDAAKYVGAYGLGNRGAPALVRFVTAVSHRFGIVVSQKALAQTLPVIGALGGGLVNTIFISHFQDMARAHFSIRRLERRYGTEAVEAAYAELASALAAEAPRSGFGKH
jgi:hypothetical protein